MGISAGSMLADYANASKIDRRWAWEFIRHHRIDLPEPYSERHFDEMMRLRRQFSKDEKGAPALIDSDAKLLEQCQPGYIAFAESLCNGKPDMDFVSLKYDFFQKNNLGRYKFQATADPWKPAPAYTCHYFRIEEIIAFKCVVHPFLSGEARKLRNFRHCAQCGAFHIPSRSDSRFCGDRCKSAHHRNLRKDSK